MATPDGGHSVKRFQLPSGRTIELVFIEPSPEPEPTADRAGASRPLHVCPACEGVLVQPLEWEELTGELWSVRLRCPSCERVETGVFPQRALDAFDQELERATEELADELQQLARANMLEAIDRFAAALAADAILPMDF